MLIAGVGLVIAHIYALLFQEEPLSGILATIENAPEVHEIIRKTQVDFIKNQGTAYTISKILVNPEPNAGTTKTNVIGSRILIIGWPLLAFLSDENLQSIIAHEFAHHERGAMLYHRASLWCFGFIAPSPRGSQLHSVRPRGLVQRSQRPPETYRATSTDWSASLFTSSLISESWRREVQKRPRREVAPKIGRIRNRAT